MIADPPALFDDLTGQDDAVRFLRTAIRRGLAAHAYLLIGPEGVGRLELARAVCHSLLCGQPVEGQACGRCRHCELSGRGSHPDHAEHRLADVDRQEFPIDVVRDQIIQQAARRPVMAARRSFIIEDIDRFSIAAANCFLKTLEEPPSGAVFILIAGSTQRIPATIISRCQLVRLRPIPGERICELLMEEGCPEEEAEWLAAFAAGSPGRARQAREAGLFGFYHEIADSLRGCRLADNMDLSNRLYSMVDSAGSARERRVMLVQLLEAVLFYYRGRLRGLAGEGRPAAGEEYSTLLEASDIILETIAAMEANANQTLALDAMWTRITLLEMSA